MITIRKKITRYVETAEQLEFSSETTGGEQVVEQQCLCAERKKKQSSWYFIGCMLVTVLQVVI